MYKYYDIIDQKSKVYLSNYEHENYVSISKELPPEFFKKNKQLFEDLRRIFITFTLLSEESIFNILETRMDRQEIYDVLYDYNNINLIRPDHDNVDMYFFVSDFYALHHIDNNTCEYYFDDMLKIIRILLDLYPKNKEYYQMITHNIVSVYKELKKENRIMLSTKDIEITIPNAWYLTKDGTLYNTMGKEGHKQSNLVYPITEIRDKRIKPNWFIDFRDKYIEEYNEILQKGYITRSQYVHYLNWYGNRQSFIEDRIYHKLIVDLVLGIIKAHIDLYDAFDSFNNVEDYDKSMEELFRLSNNRIDDILVRFAKMSKLKVYNKNIICTSNTSEKDFYEYLEKGYIIDLVNPIEVRDGEIKEKDISYVQKIRRVLR